jgi:hypothetical protein
MKTEAELMTRAMHTAIDFFYSDGDTPWPAYERLSEAELIEEVESLAEVVYFSMQWARGEVK